MFIVKQVLYRSFFSQIRSFELSLVVAKLKKIIHILTITIMLKQIFILVVLMFSILTTTYASDIPLKGPDLPTLPTRPRALAPRQIPVTVDLSSTDIFINFTNSVGIAVVTIKDSEGSIVSQELLDTDSESELYISIEDWDSGDYTITIEYGSTTLNGEFSL